MFPRAPRGGSDQGVRIELVGQIGWIGVRMEKASNAFLEGSRTRLADTGPPLVERRADQGERQIDEYQSNGNVEHRRAKHLCVAPLRGILFRATRYINRLYMSTSY